MRHILCYMLRTVPAHLCHVGCPWLESTLDIYHHHLFARIYTMCFCSQRLRLIIGQCLRVIGSGGVTVATCVLLVDLFEGSNRVMIPSFIGLAWVFETICWPLVSGRFTSRGSWVCHSFVRGSNINRILKIVATDVLDQSSSVWIQLCNRWSIGTTHSDKRHIHRPYTTC